VTKPSPIIQIAQNANENLFLKAGPARHLIRYPYVVAAFQQESRSTPEAAKLAPREQEVPQLLARGLLYKEIADQLGISIATVRAHVGPIYQKLHVRNRSEAVLKAFPQRKT
jgi:DNA-binding NarL/FixJ family response regulator